MGQTFDLKQTVFLENEHLELPNRERRVMRPDNATRIFPVVGTQAQDRLAEPGLFDKRLGEFGPPGVVLVRPMGRNHRRVAARNTVRFQERLARRAEMK